MNKALAASIYKARPPASTLVCVLACMLGCAAPQAARETPRPADPLAGASGQELFELGQEVSQRGDFVRAEQYLAAAIERGYPAQRALPLLLEVCIAGSRLSAARQYATPYLQLHPEDFQLRYVVAAVELGLGRPEAAKDEVEQVLVTAPDFAPAHYLLGILLRDHFGDAKGAAQHLAEHQRLDPGGVHDAEVSAWLRRHDSREAGLKGQRKRASGATQ